MSTTPPEFHPEEPQQMPRHLIARDETGFASAKMAGFQYTAVAIFLFLISGFWQLQIQSPDVYSERAEHNRVKVIPVGAPRGKILDRDGRVIVDNQPSWKRHPLRATKPEAGAFCTKSPTDFISITTI